MSRYLMIDFGSTFTKLVAVDTEKEDIIGTASHFTTVDTDIVIGYKRALIKLSEKLGTEDLHKERCRPRRLYVRW